MASALAAHPIADNCETGRVVKAVGIKDILVAFTLSADIGHTEKMQEKPSPTLRFRAEAGRRRH